MCVGSAGRSGWGSKTAGGGVNADLNPPARRECAPSSRHPSRRRWWNFTLGNLIPPYAQEVPPEQQTPQQATVVEELLREKQELLHERERGLVWLALCTLVVFWCAGLVANFSG